MSLCIIVREHGQQVAQVIQRWELPSSGKDAERIAFDNAACCLRDYWSGNACPEIAGSATAADEASDVDMPP